MQKTYRKFIGASFFVLILFTSCTTRPGPTTLPIQTTASTQILPAETLTPSSTPEPPRVLSICMGREPASLFLYGDSSVAARSIREAIYDGPVDIRGFEVEPVILGSAPSLENGAVLVEPVQVETGRVILDGNGEITTLKEGVTYLPSQCKDPSCAQVFTGQEAVTMDQLAVRFKLRPGLSWSDGAPLTADDSLYSFEVARSLSPQVRVGLVSRTESYQALDEATLEWRGVPGFLDSLYRTNFFTPLPRHAWGLISSQDLFTNEISARLPIGWGPYVIDEWTPGDHISLSKNPIYFRSSEGLPFFDKLVYRFVSGSDEAMAALLSGECDYVDESIPLDAQGPQLLQLEEEGRLAVSFETGTAWEHADFGIGSWQSSAPQEGQPPALFQQKEARQAVAMCIDRQTMAKELFFAETQVSNTYLPPDHPLYNAEAKQYVFDPQAASALLQSSGWSDVDNDPSTPRIAQGVPGVQAGTPFEFNFLTTDEEEKQRAAQIVQTSLAQCGIKVNINAMPWDELMASGPDGPVFGRKFPMAQFGWITALEPPCFLYTTAEIPGPYPEYPKGWGGANASGYSSPEFDRACQQARFSLPDTPEYQAAHRQAQAIFAEDLPAIPLYLRTKLVATRPDMCGVVVDPSAESTLWNLEAFDYGDSCPR